MPRVDRFFVGVLLVLCTLIPLYSGGTTDVGAELGKIEAIERDGVVNGFINNHYDYPPFFWVLLQSAPFLHQVLNIEMFLALKWSIIAFLTITSVLFFLWTRNEVLTIFLHLSLLLNSVALGYVDVYPAPALILAFWALSKRKFFWFTAFYTIACLIKWQPTILGPFLVVYLVKIINKDKWRTILPVVLRDMVLPAALLIGGAILVFGEAFFDSLKNAMSHTVLSGYALNYNWLLTYYLRLTQPGLYGPLGDGIADYIEVTNWSVVGFSKIAFAVFYLAALWIFIRRPNSFKNLLRYTMVGFLAYFTFNTGVHENHLFIAGLLSVILYSLDRRSIYLMLVLVLMMNVNLFVFYGVNGGPAYSRLLGVDITVFLASFNVAFFLALWAGLCLRGKGSPIEDDADPLVDVPSAVG